MPSFTSNQTGNFLLQYAGVPFLLDQAKIVRMDFRKGEPEPPATLEPPRKHQPMDEILDELNRVLDWRYLNDFALPGDYPGRNLGAVARQDKIGPYPCPELKIQDFYYPPTASRWAVFRGLLTSTQVDAILAATDGFNPALFQMLANPLSPDNPGFDASLYTIETQLYCLPPRPLGEHGKQFDGLYLVTLVDERYYFQGTPVSLHVRQGTTWTNLINQLADALDVEIGIPTIDSVYLNPEQDSHLWSNFESAPVLLDAIAWNIGKTVVRNLDGTYDLLTPAESGDVVDTNRGSATTVVRLAGGGLFEVPKSPELGDVSVDRNEIVPSVVNVTFPKYVYGNDPVPHFLNSRYQNQRPSAWFEESFGDVYNIAIPISQGGSLTAGLTGVSDETIQDTAKALLPTEVATTPDNLTALTALATRLATDLYNYRLVAALDEVYPGTFAWEPEGIHDLIWTYSAKTARASLRVLKCQWNQMVSQMQHSTPPLANMTGTPKGVGGPSVAQTIRDSLDNTPIPPQITPIATTLAVAATATDTSFTFTKIDYFPTQNRWRGQVDNEIILFEGTNPGTVTSQGVVVQIVYRGIDGTLAAAHDKGAPISQIAPDVGYGINLTTYEKSQFVYPAEWTSGGIQGMNIVPQMQTVQVLDGTGTLINKITHYSGRVQTYDTTMMSGSQWFNEELIWAVERSALPVSSGGRYDGQILGYSASGMVAPVYAIGDASAGAVNITSGGGGGGGSLTIEELGSVNPFFPPFVEFTRIAGVADIACNHNDGYRVSLLADFITSQFDKPLPAVSLEFADADTLQKGAVSLFPQMLGQQDKYFHDHVGLFNQQWIFWGGDQSIEAVPIETTLMLADDGTNLNPLPPGFPTPPFWGVFFVNSSQIYLSHFNVGGGGGINTGRTRFTIKSQDTVLAIPEQISVGDGVAYEIIDAAGNDFVGCNVFHPSRVCAVGGIVVGFDDSPDTLTTGDIANIAAMISLRV